MLTMSQQEQDISNLKTRSRSPSPIRTNSTEILTLQKELKDKEHELNIAYQTSLELIETNNELQQHLEEQSSTIQILDANILDYEMKIDMLASENQEYQHTIFQTNDKYEQLLGELAVTREHLNNSTDEISEYQRTIQSLNHDIINNKHTTNSSSNYSNQINKYILEINESKDKILKQQNKYDELLRECEKLRNESDKNIDLQIEIENMKKEQMKLEKRNKLLSDKIVELTYNNVQLEKEINDYTLDINEQNETIKYLQSENQNLMTKKLQTETKTDSIKNISIEPNKLTICDKNRLYSTTAITDSTLSTFINTNNNKENIDLKRRLSIQLRDNFSDNSKLVMFSKKINSNELDYNMNECENENELELNDDDDDDDNQNDLFTMVQNYENNDEYLRNAEINNENNNNNEREREREDSLSDLENDTQSQIESIDILQNKSRIEKTVDNKQRKGSKSSTTSLDKDKKSKSPSTSRHTNSSLRSSHNKNNKNNKNKKRTYPRKHGHGAYHRKTDALDEYLHLTASAVKINYPTVNATSKELIEMVKSLPFYQAHDHLNRYMMERLRWEQIQQNKLLQLKAAAIQSQRDHKFAQQSTVTRLFKKWFTTEYDDQIEHIIHNQKYSPQNKQKKKRNDKGQIDLSSPLTKKENFRLNRVGKAKLSSTSSGGVSVNLGSLNPKGKAPKGTTKKKRIIKSTNYSNYSNYNESQKLRRKREKKLKSLAMTQTLPSQYTNKHNKQVQHMADIHEKHMNKIIKQNIQKAKKNEKPITIKINTKQNKVKSNNTNDKINGHKKTQPSQQQQQKQGWISWLTGTHPPPPQYINKRDKDNEIHDPYALAPVQKKKKRRSNGSMDKKNKKGKKLKSKSPKIVDKDKIKELDDSKQEEVIDIDQHIKNVIRMHDSDIDDDDNDDVEKKNDDDIMVVKRVMISGGKEQDNNDEEYSNSRKVVNDKLTLEKLPEFEGNDDENKDVIEVNEIKDKLNDDVNDIVIESNVNDKNGNDNDNEMKEVNEEIEIEQVNDNDIETEIEPINDIKEDNTNNDMSNIGKPNDNISESASYITEEEAINNNAMETMEDITTQIFNNTKLPIQINLDSMNTKEKSLSLPSIIGSDANASLQNLNMKININDLPDIDENNNNNISTDPYALSTIDNKSEIEASITSMDDNSINNSNSNDNNVEVDVIESKLDDTSDDLDDILLPVQQKTN